MTRVVPAPLTIHKGQLYTMAELAAVLRCTNRCIYNYRLEGRFKFIVRGGVFLVSGSEVLYLKAHGLRPVTEEYRREARASKRAYRKRVKERAEAKATQPIQKAKAKRPSAGSSVKGKAKGAKAKKALTSVKTH